MATDIRDISRRVFEEIWNNKNLNAADEVIASDYVHTTLSPHPFPMESTDTKNLSAIT